MNWKTVNDVLLEHLIRQAVKDFQFPKPKSICICDNPAPGKFDHMNWAKCKTCRQQLAEERCVNMGLL